MMENVIMADKTVAGVLNNTLGVSVLRAVHTTREHLCSDMRACIRACPLCVVTELIKKRRRRHTTLHLTYAWWKRRH